MPAEKKNSSKNRETEKRRIAREQILSNQLEVHYTAADGAGNMLDTVKVHPIAVYSTKFMSTDDQFTLAVDKIAFPELKSAFLPAETHPERFENPRTDVYDYASVFSLNDGDKNALALLLEAFRDGSKKQYVADDGTRMVAYMAEGSNQRIQFDFDMYGDGKFSGDAGVPSITASFVLSKSTPSDKYTSTPVWNYVLTIHQLEAKLPKDVALKSEYDLFQGIMRAVTVSLGILPSKLDLAGDDASGARVSPEFMEIGTAISSW